MWMLQRGHSGDGCVLASTLCKYDLRKGDLFVLSWARVRRVRRGSISSELLVCGGGVRSILPLVARCLEMNDEITRITNKHKRQKLRQFVETLDHKTDPPKLWRTIKAIDGKSMHKAENEAITFDGCQVSFTKQVAKYFNRQFTTSKLGRHTFSRETRLVSREIKRKLLTLAVTFTTDQVTKGISRCSNT